MQPRIIQESDIAVAPPHVREIWNYLLREANSQDKKYGGHEIKRGQLFRTYDDIREGTKWFIGWRKMMYNENQTKKAMKFLRDTGRIATRKEPGGVLITICKYDFYQDPKNYERTKERTTERTNDELSGNQTGTTYNKNDKNGKNGKKEDIEPEKYNSNKPVNKIIKPTKVSRGKKSAVDFVDKIVDAFVEVHGDYEIVNKGKERQAAGKLLNLYKKKYPDADSEQTLDGLKAYFKKCVKIDDNWLRDNMSLPLIVSKFNEIKKKLTNGTPTRQKQEQELDQLWQDIRGAMDAGKSH